MNTPNQIQVFDTTLRDGEQMPHVAFSAEDKLAVARLLDQMGVNVIEAGFPANSRQEIEAVRRVAGEVKALVCGIARVVRQDLEAAVSAKVGMIDVFCSTSPIQMEKSMRTTPEKVLVQSVDAVRFVKDQGLSCMFTPMDATRTDPAFLNEIAARVSEAGADWIGLTDTVGVGDPFSVARMVESVRNAVDTPISIHCHDDFGLATANTLAAVRSGASMVQVCVNGLGERAGNASLEEVAMALKCLLQTDCGIDTRLLKKVSKLVERVSGLPVPPNKPVVGENAFTHESGIHAAGVMRDGSTFEPGVMTPEMVGQNRKLVLGKHTGKHGVAQALAEAGLNPGESELKEIMQRVKSLADKGKQILNTDLFAIADTVMQKLPKENRSITLDQLVVTTGDKILPTASLRAKVRGEVKVEAQVGLGPVDAAFRAVRKMLEGEIKVEIAKFHVNAITGGSRATVRVSVTVEDEEGRQAQAQAAHVDIVMASVDALLTATNHLLTRQVKEAEKAA